MRLFATANLPLARLRLARNDKMRGNTPQPPLNTPLNPLLIEGRGEKKPVPVCIKQGEEGISSVCLGSELRVEGCRGEWHSPMYMSSKPIARRANAVCPYVTRNDT
ncbi:MAG: hypothetical protein HYW14_01250 [Planctomycetes bacterium]|nr:hypothetical protein [Planctomycetota bacterium]